MSFTSLLFFFLKGEINKKKNTKKTKHTHKYVRKPSPPQTSLELSWKLIGLLTKMLKTTVG